jgi:hypothetical protein
MLIIGYVIPVSFDPCTVFKSLYRTKNLEEQSINEGMKHRIVIYTKTTVRLEKMSSCLANNLCTE